MASMLITSCEKNQDLGVAATDEATLSFNVTTPLIQNRAFSDGYSATKLQYAVYNSNGEILNNLTVTNATMNDDLTATVSFKLTVGNTYSFIFWAAHPDAPYNVDLAAKTMTVDYTGAVCNDEKRDAFYAYVEPFKVVGSDSKTVELKRPFAQLNVGVNDFVDSTNAGYTVAQSRIEAPAYETLNLETGVVSNLAVRTFDFANIPDSSEVFPVANYEYLAMSYLLMAADPEVVEVKFFYNDTTSAVVDPDKGRTVGSVPVQRNHRTNIYGQILTANLGFTVVIKPGYDDDAHQKPVDSL